MPRGSRRAVTKGAPYGKGRRSREKRYAVRRAAPVAAKQASIPESIPAAPPTRVSPAMQQMVAPQPHVLKDLKRIGIITGVMLLLLIILYLVL